MGIPYNANVVEYAYVKLMRTFPNIATTVIEDDVAVTKYQHRVQIIYELKTNDKVTAGADKSMSHFTERTDTMDTAKQFQTKLNNNLDTWIAEDKKELSGY